MKFLSIRTFIFVSVVAGRPRVLESARGLEEAEENEYAFLSNYQMKMISCTPDGSIGYTGFEMEQFGRVVFRLCPSNGNCSDAAGKSCDAGYGEYVIGINDFVHKYLVQIREEPQVDDDFDIEQLPYCHQYADSDYYAGPRCTTDRTNIRMALFTDENCKHLAENVIFDDISAGIALPYYEGRLVSDSCESCSSVNDNGEAGVSEMCLVLYEQVPFKCESEMEFHRNDPDYDFFDCRMIELFTSQTKQSGTQSGAGMVIVVIIVVILIGISLVGFALSVMEKEKKIDAVGDVKNYGLIT